MKIFNKRRPFPIEFLIVKFKKIKYIISTYISHIKREIIRGFFLFDTKNKQDIITVLDLVGEISNKKLGDQSSA